MNIKQILLITFVIAIFSFAFTSADSAPCPLTMSQNQTSVWEDKGVMFSVWEVVLTNTGMTSIYDAVITADAACVIKSIWTLEVAGQNKYHFPGFLCQNGLTNGASIKFGYIAQGTASASFTITDLQFK